MIANILWLTLSLILVVIAGVLLIFAAYQSSHKRIGFIVLPSRCIPKVVEALELRDGDTFYELGCGDGRILAAALGSNPKLHGVGIEYNPIVLALAQYKLRGFGKRASILRGDLMNQDLSPATRIFTYLSDSQMALLEPKLNHELAAGSRLVSCDFRLPTRQPTRTITVGETQQLGQTLYLYDF
jgi:SAM-dependent methyltransferase